MKGALTGLTFVTFCSPLPWALLFALVDWLNGGAR